MTEVEAAKRLFSRIAEAQRAVAGSGSDGPAGGGGGGPSTHINVAAAARVIRAGIGAPATPTVPQRDSSGAGEPSDRGVGSKRRRPEDAGEVAIEVGDAEGGGASGGGGEARGGKAHRKRHRVDEAGGDGEMTAVAVPPPSGSHPRGGGGGGGRGGKPGGKGRGGGSGGGQAVTSVPQPALSHLNWKKEMEAKFGTSGGGRGGAAGR